MHKDAEAMFTDIQPAKEGMISQQEWVAYLQQLSANKGETVICP